ANDVFGTDSLPDDASMENVEAWDSVNHLNFVMAVEAAFSVSLDPHDIERMTSLAEAARVIDAKRLPPSRSA
ncbi:MAG: acyl carrier protein, partial [Phycisphaerae bacterium]|nr:acyl carrier protein [Phycisphaerae bacterium]